MKIFRSGSSHWIGLALTMIAAGLWGAESKPSEDRSYQELMKMLMNPAAREVFSPKVNDLLGGLCPGIVVPVGINFRSTDEWPCREKVAAGLNRIGYARYREKSYAPAFQYFDLAHKFNMADMKVQYNLACAQSLLGRKTEAIETLIPLLQIDRQKYIQKIEKDPDFDPLRSSAEFKDLLSQGMRFEPETVRWLTAQTGKPLALTMEAGQTNAVLSDLFRNANRFVSVGSGAGPEYAYHLYVDDFDQDGLPDLYAGNLRELSGSPLFVFDIGGSPVPVWFPNNDSGLSFLKVKKGAAQGTSYILEVSASKLEFECSDQLEETFQIRKDRTISLIKSTFVYQCTLDGIGEDEDPVKKRVAIIDEMGRREIDHLTLKGKAVSLPPFNWMLRNSEFHDGLAPVFLNGKGGYIDKTGRFAIEPRFDSVSNFSEGLAAVSINGKTSYIDKSGRVVFDLDYDWSRFPWATQSLSGVKVTGIELVTVEAANVFCGGRADLGIVANSPSRIQGIVSIDRSGKIVDEPQWGRQMVPDASCEDNNDSPLPKSPRNLIPFTVNNLWGFKNRAGNIAIPARYADRSEFSEGLAVVAEIAPEGGESPNPPWGGK